MPLPLLGLAAGIGKALVVGTAKAAVVGAKVGAKTAVSSGKFFAKGGASLARGGARVARQGGEQVVKGTKFFKKKVGGIKRKGGEISKKLKENATNLRDSLKKGNKNQDKLRAKGTERKKKKESIEKKQGKEKELESKKSTSGSKKNILSGLAKSPLSIFNKLFGLGGLLLAGILVNSAKGLIDKAKQFVADNKELFDTIGNFLSGIKDAAVGLFDSFTGPESEKGFYDDFAKFDDLGNLESGKLKGIENAYSGFGELINKIDKALGGEGTAGNALIADKKVLAEKGGKTGVLNQTTDEFQEMEFNEEQKQRYEQTKSGVKPTPSPDNKKVTSQASTPVGLITPGGTLDFVGSGDGATGKLILKDKKGKKLGNWEAISGVFRTANTSQEDRRNVSGTLNPLPDGTYPLMGFAKHGYVDGVGTWSTYINNLSGAIGSRSQLLVHNDIGSNGTAGCVGVELGGVSGTSAENEFLKLYEAAKPTSINVSISKGANKLASSTRPSRSTDNTRVSTARLSSSENKNNQIASINQPMDDEGGETIFIQRVNTVQYVPFPVTT